LKVCVAQIRPVKGDIQSNIDIHKKLISLAASNGAAIIIFPELSLTGYEPQLAEELATHAYDTRFEDFQTISNNSGITIGVGVPIKNTKGISISMVLFQPQQERQTYSKKYLHADEEPFFVSGENSFVLFGNKTKIALAICYEISVPEHAHYAFENGAEMYIASVAKSVAGVDKAIERLSEIGAKYSMTVLMSNCIGESDGEECGGKTSIWNNKGVLLGQLDSISEGILIIDTGTQELVKTTVKDFEVLK
jgi:predicted amidohydrolase